MQANEEFVVFPPFGTNGACKDYDSDCFEMTPEERQHCCFNVFGELEDRDGICPFYAD